LQSLNLEKDLKKLAATFIASLFATVAFAQTQDAPAPHEGAPKAAHHEHHHHKKQTKKPVVLDKTKLGEGHLQ
jgi:hypothetical protein